MKDEYSGLKRLRTFTDKRGSLTLAEAENDIPFEIKRVYWIHDVPEYAQRGHHANHVTWQYLVAVHGCVEVFIESAEYKDKIILDDPSKGLVLPPYTWNDLISFSSDAVLLVLASGEYDASTYINSYSEFLKIIGSDVENRTI